MKKFTIGKRLVMPLLFLLMAIAATAQKPKIRVACVGNSVTYGYGMSAERRPTDCYPAQLQRLLGDNYEVGNFGHSGATLCFKGYRPYIQQEAYRKAKEFAGDIVVIHLGLNDTDPRVWPDLSDQFAHDYCSLIDTFRTVNPKARIIIAKMSPIFTGHARWESGTRDWHQAIQQEIEKVAKQSGVELIDFYTPLKNRPDLFPDNLHPTADGATILAQTVYNRITDYAHTPVAMASIFQSGMVIQRNEPIVFRGTATAAKKLEICFAGKTLSTTADHNGHWKVTFDSMPAGGPYDLTVTSTEPVRKSKKKMQAQTHIAMDNIYVGEVWLCSGQSNMARTLPQFGYNAEATKANEPRLHVYNMLSRFVSTQRDWDQAFYDKLNRLEFFEPTTWQTVTPEVAKNLSALAYFFGKELSDSLDCHVGIIMNAVGGATQEAWMSPETIGRHCSALMRRPLKNNDFYQDWVRKCFENNLCNTTFAGQRHPFEASYLYESGIDPIKDYNIKGVIWYQGESNAHNAEHYMRMFPLLKRDFSRAFGKRAIPFHAVQLSSIATRPSWAMFRNAQRIVFGYSHCPMTVCSDLGDRTDVHPTRKRELAHRLVASALYYDYGKLKVVPCGPTPTSQIEVNDTEAVMTFNFAEGLTTSDGKAPATFELADENGLYHAVETSIADNKVHMKYQGFRPTAVRYGWQCYSMGNLVNAAGMPCSTFEIEIKQNPAGQR